MSAQTSPPNSGIPLRPALRQPSRLAPYARVLWPLLVLAAILLYNACFNLPFFNVAITRGHFYGSLIDVLKHGATTMLLATGMTLVIATGGIDLSVGAIMAIVGGAASVLMARPDYAFLSAVNLHGNVWLVVGLALLLALLAGLWNGLLVAWVDVQPIVATLILMISGRGVAQLLTNGQIPTIDRALNHEQFAYIGKGFMLGFPFPLWLALGMALLTGLLTRFTALGLFVESIGNNATASRYAGVNARMVKIVAYMWCGLCAGIAGLIETSNIDAGDVGKLGMYMELDAILAAAIGGASLAGGRFSLLGSLIGALVIQSLTTTILMGNVRPEWALVVKAIVVILVCLLQSGKIPGVDEAGAAETAAGGAGMSLEPPQPSAVTPRLLPQQGDFWASLATRQRLPMLTTAMVCLLLYGAASWHWYDRNFFSTRVFIDFFRTNAVLGVAAIGMTFVILAGGIDLSIGALIGCGSIAIAAMVQAGVNPFVAMGIVLIAGTLLGAGMGCLIHFFDLPPFLVTLGGLFLYRGMGLLISTESISLNQNPIYRTLSEFSVQKVLPSVIANELPHVPLNLPLILFLGLLLAAMYLSLKTSFGRNVYAIGGSESSAVLMGLPVGRTKVLTYALCGLCGGFAAVLHTIDLTSGEAIARTGLELDAIAAVVVGGTLLSGGVGQVGGTLLGIWIFGIINAAINFQGNLSSWWQKITVGLLLLVFVLLQKVIQPRRAKR